MFGSEILEVAIGIIFVFLLISTICTAIREGIEAWLKSRAAYLEYGIRELLHDKTAKGLAKSFYKHPLIYGLFSEDYKPSGSAKRPPILANGANLPSYIPSKNFALALMDIAARGPDPDVVSSDPNSPVISLDNIRRNILNLQNPPVQRVLLSAIDSAQGDLSKAQANIEAWFDSSMDRVSGWYKRSTQWIIFWVALVVVIGLNVNTITIADFLYRDDATRAAIIARVETAVKEPNYQNSENYKKATADLDSLGLPIGWTEGWGAPKRGKSWEEGGRWNNLFAPFLGWLMTAFAASLGAPFWFDVLNKVMEIRSTIKPREKGSAEASEDRQLPAVRTSPAMGAGATTAGVVGTGAAVISPPPSESLPTPTDAEGDLDGCDVEIDDPTPDEALPEAKGGMA